MASSLGMMARRARPSDDRGRYQSDHRDRADCRQAGRARDYNVKALREKERALVAQGEAAYSRFVAALSERPKGSSRRAGAAKGVRR